MSLFAKVLREVAEAGAESAARRMSREEAAALREATRARAKQTARPKEIERAIVEPKVTVPAYRAHRVFLEGDPRYEGLSAGEYPLPIYPVMIGKDIPVNEARGQRIPMDTWLKSQLIPFQMAPRKGWHAGVAPYGPQWNTRRGQPHNTLYSEVELGADRDFSNFTDPSKSPIIYQEGDELPFGSPIDLPEGGFYAYSPGGGKNPWLVSDYVKHKRLLTDEEVADRMRAAGLEPPPERYRGDEKFRWTEKKLKDYGLRGLFPVMGAGMGAIMYQLMEEAERSKRALDSRS